MSKAKTKVIRYRVALDVKKDDYKNLGPRAQGIYDTTTGHPGMFSGLGTLLAVLQTRIQAFTTAQQKVGKEEGATEDRDLRAMQLFSCLTDCRNGVQQLCDASPEEAPKLAAAAGMKLCKMPVRTKQLLEAVQLKPATTVHLEVNVGLLIADLKGKVCFNWQHTPDGGKTWVDAPTTPHGKTDIAGLTAMQTYGFRVAVTHAKGTTEWCQVVNLLVT